MGDLFWYKLMTYILLSYLKQDEQLEGFVEMSQRTLGPMPVQY